MLTGQWPAAERSVRGCHCGAFARSKGFIFCVAGIVFLAFGFDVYDYLRDGHAAETYQNVYGWNIPWTTPAVLSAAIALVALCSWLMRWWVLWRRSRIEGVPTSQIAKEFKRNE
jgi:hypothetical protein